ncbi:MAG: hypothetical protein SXV54_12855 [Chloroflexota bacterium]|nr:hypothetical protein [Chloroflexota bacterium]
MPTRRIDELVWMSLTDSDFRARLLNGQRRETVTNLNLTPAESEAVMAVKANSLETFARALCRPLDAVPYMGA